MNSATFDHILQERFARASGDVNPMHMDAVLARRTVAGAPVVHGVHAALWAIDAMAASGRLVQTVQTIDVQFQKFIYVGDDVTIDVTEKDSQLRADLTVGGLVTSTIKLGFVAAEKHATPISAAAIAIGAAPQDCALPDLASCRGRIESTRSGAAIAEMFPNAASALTAQRVEAIAHLSTIVGMVCPGLHSLFSGFTLTISEHQAPGIAFETTRVDQRFNKITMNVFGSGIEGTVTAFFRPPPVLQRPLHDVRQAITSGEFAETHALIVGGSRGIGAATARAIVAGGGRVVITYLIGEGDARAIAEELGDACSVMRYDARKDANAQLAALDRQVNELYYFATSHIARQKASGFSQARYDEFHTIFVDGFARACIAVRARTGADVTAFYPSSVYVDERPKDLAEYAAAKAAGEALCEDLTQSAAGLHVMVKRLPRLRTDQAASVLPSASSDPTDVMIPILREMRALRENARLKPT